MYSVFFGGVHECVEDRQVRAYQCRFLHVVGVDQSSAGGGVGSFAMMKEPHFLCQKRRLKRLSQLASK